MQKFIIFVCLVMALGLSAVAQDASPTPGSTLPKTSASPAQAADAANPPAESVATADQQAQASPKADAELPQTASPLPLYALLAFGFLCAGYMTLRMN